eukprot:UC1_evm1s2185
MAATATTTPSYPQQQRNLTMSSTAASSSTAVAAAPDAASATTIAALSTQVSSIAEAWPRICKLLAPCEPLSQEELAEAHKAVALIRTAKLGPLLVEWFADRMRTHAARTAAPAFWRALAPRFSGVDLVQSLAPASTILSAWADKMVPLANLVA